METEDLGHARMATLKTVSSTWTQQSTPLTSSACTSSRSSVHSTSCLIVLQVKRCPRARPHDWTQCPFAHPGEKARRRDPRRYKYSGTACPEFRKSGCCRRGDACPFAHGVFECWLHPSRYRTQLCTDGPSCRRRVCFFAHVETELRHPEDDPAMAQKQVQAELATEVQTLQQQHLTQALQALISQGTNPAPSPDRPSNHGQVLTNELLKQNPTTLPIGVGSNNAFGESGDQGNSTSALHAALMHHLQQNGGDKSSNGGQVHSASEGMNSNDLHTAGAPLTDVYSALNQLQQLMLDPSTTGIPTSSPPSNGSNDIAPTSLNPAAILSQMMSGNANPATIPTSVGELTNNSLLSSLLNQQQQQNAAKLSMTNGNIPPVRRSIDNSYFNLLNSDANAAMAAAAQFGSAGFPVALQNGGFMQNLNSMTTAQELNVPTSVNTTVPVSGPSIPADSMYSVENIQLLLQNPAFSSNLSQLFQMNPGLVEQLTSTANEDSNPTRHSIDNAYLSQLNTDINHFVNNGGVKNGSGSEVVTHVMTPAQQEAMMMTSDLFSQPNGTHHGYANGLSVSEALIQSLNALKMQIEGNPTAPPLTVQAPTPLIENGQGSASHLSVQSSSNHSSSESAFQASSDTSGNDGNCEITNSSNIAAADPQLESLE